MKKLIISILVIITIGSCGNSNSNKEVNYELGYVFNKNHVYYMSSSKLIEINFSVFNNKQQKRLRELMTTDTVTFL